MSLKDIVAKNQKEITAKWIEAVNGSYPFGTVGFLRTKTNQFINPVGYRNNVAAEAFVACLFEDEPEEEAISGIIDEFIKVRAVQDFSVEDAVGIILALKPVISDVLGESLEAYIKENGLKEYRILEGHIDALTLLAFGAYTRCREKMADLRVDEFKRKHSQIIRQAERVLNQKFPEHRLK